MHEVYAFRRYEFGECIYHLVWGFFFFTSVETLFGGHLLIKESLFGFTSPLDSGNFLKLDNTIQCEKVTNSTQKKCWWGFPMGLFNKNRVARPQRINLIELMPTFPGLASFLISCSFKTMFFYFLRIVGERLLNFSNRIFSYINVNSELMHFDGGVRSRTNMILEQATFRNITGKFKLRFRWNNVTAFRFVSIWFFSSSMAPSQEKSELSRKKVNEDPEIHRCANRKSWRWARISRLQARKSRSRAIKARRRYRKSCRQARKGRRRDSISRRRSKIKSAPSQEVRGQSSKKRHRERWKRAYTKAVAIRQAYIQIWSRHSQKKARQRFWMEPC